MVHREDPDARDSELDPRNGRVYGPAYTNGNGSGTAQKIVWGAAAFAFTIVVLLVGGWMNSMNSLVTSLSTQLAKTEEHVEYLQRQFDRLQK